MTDQNSVAHHQMNLKHSYNQPAAKKVGNHSQYTPPSITVSSNVPFA